MTNIDSEAYWLKRLEVAQENIDRLRAELASALEDNHKLRNDLAVAKGEVQEARRHIIELQKKEFYANEY